MALVKRMAEINGQAINLPPGFNWTFVLCDGSQANNKFELPDNEFDKLFCLFRQLKKSARRKMQKAIFISEPQPYSDHGSEIAIMASKSRNSERSEKPMVLSKKNAADIIDYLAAKGNTPLFVFFQNNSELPKKILQAIYFNTIPNGFLSLITASSFNVTESSVVLSLTK